MIKRFAVLVNILVILTLLVPPPLWATTVPPSTDTQESKPAPGDSGLFRTRVTLPNSAARGRLDELGVTILDEGDEWALVLVTAGQLETLARLRFSPQATNDLNQLASRNTVADAGLATSLNTALSQATQLQSSQAAESLSAEEVEAQAQSLLATLSPEQLAAVGEFNSVDDDGDGLTNTQESWWCTEPLNPDTDSDGKSDGEEIQTLRDWLHNRRSGPPFETPWPNWPPDIPGCEDKDHDSIPNLAERWDLGLSMDLESTDRDRYDDGQELFGTTYCPGSSNACGYGALPSANHDGIVLFPQMPSWVGAPGNHPLAAALSRLEFTIVPGADGSDFKIQTATVVTTDERFEEGETKTYSTTKTDGTSTSDSETQTWENWQEYSKTTEVQDQFNAGAEIAPNATVNSTQQRLQFTNIRTSNITNQTANVSVNNTYNEGGGSSLVGELSAPVSGFVLDEACAEVNCKKYAGSAIRAGVRTFVDVVEGTLLGTSDKIQDEFRANNCDATSFNWKEIGCRIKSAGTLWKKNYDERVQAATIAEQDARGQTSGTYLETGNSYLDMNRIFPIEFPEPRFTPTETNTTGSATGGARETTHTRYEEHSVTEGTTEQFGKSWGTATAENSVHAADLWFAYELSNIGDDYARVICDLAINIYIGDQEVPAATYYPGQDLGGDGCFSNFQPGESHKYSFPSDSRIALTLDQLAAIDQGEPVRFVVEDFSLGQDDFYADDAVNAAMTISIDDGMDDGTDDIATYIIPTWNSETVLDVLARYFPHEIDANGLLVAVWLPEYRSDTPDWCVEPRVVGTGSQRAVWCKHSLTSAEWWNVYTDGLGGGDEGFQDSPASPGSLAFFRFNKDSDLDGYSDRSEQRLHTNPNDPSDYPQPELIAGLHTLREGNHVTSTLSFLNTGLYDVYGVEAVMIAPNDSISITNNTVGGSGRVRAQDQVVVGSRILPPTYGNSTWSGTARPLSDGYYTGDQDRVFTVTVDCPATTCTIGSGDWSLLWVDSAGDNGTVNAGDGYASPTFLNLGSYGVQLAFLSGDVRHGDSFTVEARTPRDTFKHQINETDHTSPVVLVSYNDPQGNHRFVTPLTLTHPADNLAGYGGQMLDGLGAEIVTTEAVTTTGNHTTDVLLNWPAGVPLQNAHVFLEFVTITGTVAAEIPMTTTVQPGPNVVSVDWNTDDFSPAFQLNEDYIVMAFWTDWQGNIIDTAARPLSSFQKDPRAEFDTDDAALTWNFGSARQGTLLRRQFRLGSTGYRDLLTYIGDHPALTVDGPALAPLAPADVAVYTVTLNTHYLPNGTFTANIPIRTSDPAKPEQTITIEGEVLPFTPDGAPGTKIRPLDTTVTVEGAYSQGEPVTYTHNLGPDPQMLHPVRVYSSNYSELLGVGEQATAFNEGTASGDMFGDGRDGDLTISSSTTFSPHDANVSGSVETNTLTVSNQSTGFTVNTGDRVLIHQTRGSGAGQYQINTVASYSNDSLVLQEPLSFSPRHSSSYSHPDKAQVIVIPQYRKVTVMAGGRIVAKPWNGRKGGIIVFFASGVVTVNGTISASGASGSRSTVSGGIVAGATGGGFRGGYGHRSPNGESHVTPQTGEGTAGDRIATQENFGRANGNGGGGSQFNNGLIARSAGGGSHGTSGSRGTHGEAGLVVGDTQLTRIFFGGGGGGGGRGYEVGTGVGSGGSGGGIVIAFAQAMVVDGGILTVRGGNAGIDTNTNGQGQQGGGASGGAGAGGSILLRVGSASFQTNRLVATGGTGTTARPEYNGAGGAGRIYIEYCTSTSGTTNPSTEPHGIDCYIIEQIESQPDQFKLQLPEPVTDTQTYAIQFGRRYTFTAAGESTDYLRLNRQVYGNASVEALVSNAADGSSLDLTLDIGVDGTVDWSDSATTTFPAALEVTGLTSALNDYLLSRDDVAWGDPVDVPVAIGVNRKADVILTNLALTPVGSKTRYLRLNAEEYSAIDLGLLFEQPGVENGDLSFTVDVGADGTIDWAWADSATFPATITSPNLAAAFNDYLSGRSGEVDVPIRIIPSPFMETVLTGFNATPQARADATLTSGDISLGGGTPTEGDVVEVTATLHNSGAADSGGVTAAFFATLPTGNEWYVGSAFVPNVPAGGSAPATISWNTLGYTGTVPLRVVIDPYNRLGETSEENNEAATDINVHTRPDLRAAEFVLSDPEPVAGQTVTATLILRNNGQTAAGNANYALYEGNPDGGTTIDSIAVASVSGQSEQTLTFSWTPDEPGRQRLFLALDEGDAVDEFDEGNNQLWRDVYVGLAGPILLDSGDAAEPTYTEARGYGYVDEGQEDVLSACDDGLQPEETVRRDPDGRLVYRFDHLLPAATPNSAGHFYHLDVTLYECDGVGRQETISVDGIPIAESVDLSDGEVHRLSLLLDPALYADHTISVTVESTSIVGAVVSAVNLHDIDYRYADAGSNDDASYSERAAEDPAFAYGFLDGVPNSTWGTLPFQTVRTDQDNNEIRYRFDGLQATSHYQVNLTLYQQGNTNLTEQVFIDGANTGVSADLGDEQPHYLTVDVPPAAYGQDGSIVVAVRRPNAGAGAFVNEISLEEETLSKVTTCEVQQTPYFSEVYGDLLIDDQPAPVGTVVQALSPRGDTVGCFTADREGLYGFMRVYGEDASATPPIPGMRDGELVSFKVNGVPAVATPTFYWSNDKASHRVDLNVQPLEGQFILLNPGWNWFSFAVQPPSPLVAQTLSSIDGQYDRVLAEDSIYASELPPVHNTLKEMGPGLGYMARVTSTTSVNLLAEGIPAPANTPLALHSGWNWVGYLPTQTLPITVALQSIAGDYQLVSGQDGTYNPALPGFNTLKQMSPGEAYMIYANQDTTLTYPESTVENTGALSSRRTPTARTTPYLTIVYGQVTLDGVPMPPRTVVEAVTPRGEVAGRGIVLQDGHLGFMHVFGVDETADPPIPGFREGEPITFRIGGQAVTPGTPLYWEDDWNTHYVSLELDALRLFLPSIMGAADDAH